MGPWYLKKKIKYVVLPFAIYYMYYLPPPPPIDQCPLHRVTHFYPNILLPNSLHPQYGIFHNEIRRLSDDDCCIYMSGKHCFPSE